MINLPEEEVPAESIGPERILFYAKPKQGKSSSLSLLPNALMIDTEQGSKHIAARKICVDITKPIHEQAAEFVEICRAIYMKGYNTETKVYKPFYETLIIDTYTRLDTWSEIVGTLNYMDRAQGKKWNTLEDGKTKISPSHKDFETVHELGQGFGYRYSREVMVDWYNKICMLSPKTIFVCHVKDKLLSTNLTEAVLTREIDLTGKVKDIISSKVDTIMYGFREGRKFNVSFSDGDGTRCPYLSGKTITLTESDESGKIITNNWGEIFPDLKQK